MPRPLVIDVAEIEQIIETLEWQSKASTHDGISSAYSIAAEHLKKLLRHHDAKREPTPADEDPDD